MSKVLTRDAIREADDLPTVPVDVPEWGGSVYLRTMTGKERDAWEIWSARNAENPENVRARLAVMTVVDEDGKNLFTEDDIEWLGGKSAAALDRIFEKAESLNKLSAEDVEELEKN